MRLKNRNHSETPKLASSEISSSIVSVSRARKILGTMSEEMTDNQVLDTIHFLHLLAKEQLLYTGSKDEKQTNG